MEGWSQRSQKAIAPLVRIAEQKLRRSMNVFQPSEPCAPHLVSILVRDIGVAALNELMLIIIDECYTRLYVYTEERKLRFVFVFLCTFFSDELNLEIQYYNLCFLN